MTRAFFSIVMPLGLLLLAGCPTDPVCDVGATQVCVCPSLAMGAQVCTSDAVWGACVCADAVDAGADAGTDAAPLDAGLDGGNDAGGDGGGEDDAGTDAGAPCSELDVATLGPAEAVASPGRISARRLSPDGTVVLVDADSEAAMSGDTVMLDDTPFPSCSHCVLVLTGCSGESCESTYLAVAGALNYVDFGPTSMTVELRDVRLEEVTLDEETSESTFVEGGAAVCIPDLVVSAEAPWP